MHFIKKEYLFCLATWLFIIAFTKAEVDPSPTIEGCQYIDAFSIDCWWKKMNGNSTQHLRLSYIKNSDHLDKQMIRYCAPTLQSINSNNDVVEHCEIQDGVLPFATFTLFLTTSTCSENSSLCHNTTSPTILFSCDPYNVVLRRGPSNFALDFPHRQLTWGPPQKDGSSLQFVSNIIQTQYKLSYRVSTNWDIINQTTWKEWYIGPQDSYYMRQLIPGAMYETKIMAAVQHTPNSEDMVWSPPSNLIYFTAPYPMYETTENDDTALNNFSTTIQTSAVNGTNSIATDAKKSASIWLICIMVITFAIVLALLIYVLICKKVCCCCPNNVKIPKPVVMIEMDDVNQRPLYFDVNEVPDPMQVTSLLQNSTKQNGALLKHITCTLKEVYPSIIAPRSNSITDNFEFSKKGRFRIRGEHPSLDSVDSSYSGNNDPAWFNHNTIQRQDFSLINEERSVHKDDSLEHQPILANSNFRQDEEPCSTSNNLFYPPEKPFLCNKIGTDQNDLKIINPEEKYSLIERYDNMDYVEEVCPGMPCLLQEKSEQFRNAFLKDTSDQIPDYIQITSKIRARQNEHVNVYVASNIDTHAFNKGIILKRLAKSCECTTEAKLSNTESCLKCGLKSPDLNGDLVFFASLCNLQSVDSTTGDNSENRNSSSSNNSIDSGYSPDTSGQI